MLSKKYLGLLQQTSHQAAVLQVLSSKVTKVKK
jgi:hypothetical protein